MAKLFIPGCRAGFPWPDSISRILWARVVSEFDYLFDTAARPAMSSIHNSVFSATQQQYAGYVQQQGSLFHGHLLVTGGFRVDGNSQFGEEISPSWAVAMPLNKYGITLARQLR